MTTASLIINLVIVLATIGTLVTYFRKDGVWSLAHGLQAFKYFTTLSNVLCAIGALLVAITELGGTSSDALPFGIWLVKYMGTAAVTVTFLTVMFFLGPTMGYKELLCGTGAYVHLLSAVFAVVSLCFLETKTTMSFTSSLWGVLPVVIYGLVYLKKVIFSPEGRSWEDFYGFNRGGKWPISFTAMMIGAFLVCVVLRLLTL